MHANPSNNLFHVFQVFFLSFCASNKTSCFPAYIFLLENVANILVCHHANVNISSNCIFFVRILVFNFISPRSFASTEKVIGVKMYKVIENIWVNDVLWYVWNYILIFEDSFRNWEEFLSFTYDDNRKIRKGDKQLGYFFIYSLYTISSIWGTFNFERS